MSDSNAGIKTNPHGLSRRVFIKAAVASLMLAACAPMRESALPPQPGTPEGTAKLVPTRPATQAAVKPASAPTALPTTSAESATATESPVEPVPSVEPTQPSLPPAPSSDPAYLAVVHGADPATITRSAIAALGGIERFVSARDQVIIKPNICVNHNTFEYASTTNPVVVATLVRMCLEAGAKRVRVMDTPYTGDPETAYRTCGILDAVIAAGGEMEVMSSVKYAKYDIPQGRDISSWSVYRDIIEADVLINVPIAKQHGSTRLTLGCKNLMGVVQSPNQFHRNLDQRIADLNTLVRPHLTVIDAVRILTAHGPGGGNLDDVKKLDTVIASHDIIAADAYATTLFGMTADDIGYIRLGAEMGLGEKNWQEVAFAESSV